MCVCVCVCVCLCEHVCLFNGKTERIRHGYDIESKGKRGHGNACLSLCVCVYVCVHWCIYVCVCVSLYVFVFDT